MTDLVVQDWLAVCSWKQQTVLLSALRGCDGIEKEDPSKILTRFFRFTILLSADTQSTFMQWKPSLLYPQMTYLVDHLDHYPMHWVLHFAHAAEIVGFKHPDKSTREFWGEFYLRICAVFHMQGETEKQLDERLRDITLETP